DTLLVMRVEALGDAPALAATLDAAARALRRGESSAIPLAWMSIRRALGGRPSLHDGLSPWQGGGAP
ncbi:MAG: hypothetical protein JWN53_1510, partial [Gemmatimonadetes bacterium]|nr:hypothetical protein [Gemmatimonadota bacterium]